MSKNTATTATTATTSVIDATTPQAKLSGEKVLVKTCPFCGKQTTIKVDAVSYVKWDMGMYVQNAFPTLSASNREVIKTGICLDCQKSIFGDE